MKKLILLLVLGFVSSATQSFAQPTLLKPQVFHDLSIQLHWQSETGAVYEIESAETLLPDENGSVRFRPREQRIVSQGTNTVWLDYGDPTTLNRTYHPSYTPHRFYRARKVAQSTNAPVSVSITSITNNATVSGDLSVQVTVNTSNQVALIRLYVDGQRVDEETDVDTFQFSINTCEWVNGPHVLHATAELAKPGETTGASGITTDDGLDVGASAPVTLHFDNLIQEFTVINPFFDPYDPVFPEIQEIYANLETNCSWSVDVVDENDTVIKTVTGTGSYIYAQWDGSDGAGYWFPPGVYDYILSATVIGGSSAGSGSTQPPGGGGTPPSLQSQEFASSEASIDSEKTEFTKGGHFSLSLPKAVRRSDQGKMQKRAPWFVQREINKANPVERRIGPEEFPMPPLPPGITNQPGWQPQPPIRPVSRTSLTESLNSLSSESEENSFFAAAVGSQTNQTTRDPRRETGRTQMSWVGATGAGSQGHHPKTNSAPWSFGTLANATAVAKGFIDKMAAGSKHTKFPAWKNNFHLIDDQLTRTNLVGAGKVGATLNSQNSKFNRESNIGFLVGHTIEYNPPGWPRGTFGDQASYPLFQSTNAAAGYTFIPDGEMRFGSQYLKWMGYYGCNSLRESRWLGGGIRERGFWPINPQLNVYCGTGSTIYIYPTMGRLWAEGIQGDLNGTPMTIITAWIEAGRRATAAENESRRKRGLSLIDHPVVMSYLYWDARQEGGSYTLSDRFQPFQASFSLTGRSVENLHFDDSEVYTP